MSVRGAAIGMAAALLAGCAGKPPPAPRAEPVVVPPAVVGEPPPPPRGEEWSDRPLTPGDWSYAGEAGGSEARFGPEDGAHFSLRCDPARRQIMVVRQGASGPLRVLTTYGARMLPPGAALAAADPLLDEMAFSRGRFAVEADGLERLILPAWAEPARVVEDCRG